MHLYMVWWPELGNPAFCHDLAKWTRQHFLALHRRSVSAFTILKNSTVPNPIHIRSNPMFHNLLPCTFADQRKLHASYKILQYADSLRIGFEPMFPLGVS
jgi:hypothetical protein